MEQPVVRPMLHPLMSGSNAALTFDPATEYLVGWPGYRTRSGRSGLDLIDSQNEFAHMLGSSTRWLLTGNFRTRNPFYLLMMVVLGLIGISPLIFSAATIALDGDWSSMRMVGFYGFHVLFGIAVLVNVVLSIFSPRRGHMRDNWHDEPRELQNTSRNDLEVGALLIALLMFIVFSRVSPLFALPDGDVIQLNFRILGFIGVLGRLVEIPRLTLGHHVLDVASGEKYNLATISPGVVSGERPDREGDVR